MGYSEGTHGPGSFDNSLPSRSLAMGCRLYEETEMNTRSRVRFIHEGKYVAEVAVELIEDDSGWSPYLSLDDAEKLDDVRAALAREDLVTASKQARVYTLQPVAASG